MTGLDSLRKYVRDFRSAFPDAQVTIDDIIAEGDRVVTRWTIRATHKGELMGIAATGKQVAFTGMAISRIEGRRIAEDWVISDALGLMQQLGAVPLPGES